MATTLGDLCPELKHCRPTQKKPQKPPRKGTAHIIKDIYPEIESWDNVMNGFRCSSLKLSGREWWRQASGADIFCSPVVAQYRVAILAAPAVRLFGAHVVALRLSLSARPPSD